MTDEFSYAEDPLDSSECSSINSSEEENHSEQQIELPHNVVGPEQKYLSALSFSFSTSIDNLLPKSLKSEISCAVESFSCESTQKRDRIGIVVHHNYSGINSNDNCLTPDFGELNLSSISETQAHNNQHEMGWPLGGLLENPFYADRSKMDDSTTKDQYPIGTSVNAESWKVKYNSDFLSMNPVVTKNSFVHLTNKLGETSHTEYKKNLPFFDFTSVKDPFMACVDKLTATPRHQFGTQRSVPTDPAVGKEGYNCDQVLVDNTKSSYVYSALGSTVNNRENVLLTNACGGSGWESLLGNSNNTDDIKSRDHGNSLAIILEIPLDFVIEKCLLEEIHLQYPYVYARCRIKTSKHTDNCLCFT